MGRTYYILMHHGIKGQKWGVMNGPPYPLDQEVSTGKQLKPKSAEDIERAITVDNPDEWNKLQKDFDDKIFDGTTVRSEKLRKILKERDEFVGEKHYVESEQKFEDTLRKADSNLILQAKMSRNDRQQLKKLRPYFDDDKRASIYSKYSPDIYDIVQKTMQVRKEYSAKINEYVNSGKSKISEEKALKAVCTELGYDTSPKTVSYIRAMFWEIMPNTLHSEYYI